MVFAQMIGRLGLCSRGIVMEPYQGLSIKCNTMNAMYKQVKTDEHQSILALCRFLRDSCRSVCACLCTGSIFFADVEAIKTLRFQ